MSFYSSGALGVSGPTRHPPTARVYAVCRHPYIRRWSRSMDRRRTRARWMICEMTRGLELCCQLATHFLLTNCVTDRAKMAIRIVTWTAGEPQGAVVSF